MATLHTVSLLSRLFLVWFVVVFWVQSAEAIKGGTTVDKRCDFPGLAVLLSTVDNVFCNGVVSDGKFIMPYRCSKMFSSVLKNSDMKVNDGIHEWTFTTTGTYQMTPRKDGTRELSLTGVNKRLIDPTVTQCDKTSSLYDGSEALEEGSCKLVGFGVNDASPVTYKPDNLKSTPIVKSTSAGCCAAILDTIPESDKGFNFVATHTFNCVTVVGAPCGLSDMGDPVMCTTVSGKIVTIGLTAGSPCVNGKLFLINDLTGSSSKTKFGVSK